MYPRKLSKKWEEDLEAGEERAHEYKTIKRDSLEVRASRGQLCIPMEGYLTEKRGAERQGWNEPSGTGFMSGAGRNQTLRRLETAPTLCILTSPDTSSGVYMCQ